jgi:hypothetical protein
MPFRAEQRAVLMKGVGATYTYVCSEVGDVGSVVTVLIGVVEMTGVVILAVIRLVGRVLELTVANVPPKLWVNSFLRVSILFL